ncbi:hypothetical protein BDW62DRAFT_153331 [Aspergillus aurantiobrunneus]
MMLGYRSRLQLCIAALITNAVSYSFPPNANHIFNAIHSSMRQWGSSLNHNGMSFFLATVPQGTLLYHGDWRSDPVQGPEWLAFEPEHALVFTHPFPHNPPPEDGRLGQRPPLERESQQVIGQPTQAEDGFLHTFAAGRDLRLLYIDGMSAGKTTNGTMDTQDRILFRDELEDDGGGMTDERKRAELFCRMAHDQWAGRLDGMLRMEAGFEVVLCDFSNLEVQQVARVRPSEQGKPGRDIGMHAGRMWLPAVASRYWNIGGDRVTLNYDHIVTAYAYGLDLFPDGGKRQPRLKHLPSGELEPMQRNLDSLILDHETSQHSTNWQSVADMVVGRYATRLRFLASGQASTLQQLQAEIEDIVTPFIDYDQRNTLFEAERCSKQFAKRSTLVTSVAADAVLSVSRSICTTLLEALCDMEYDSVVDRIQDLMDYLAWTTWKDCNGCGDHEICMIPMWPMGTVDDYEHPRCRDFSQLNGDGPRYWGEPPRPPKSVPSPAL